MGFLDNLRANNQTLGGGGSSYFGNPGMSSGGADNPADALSSIMPLFHQIRNRNLEDYKNKAQFTSDLQLRQERLRSMFDPATQQNNGQTAQNVVYQPPASDQQITPYQRANIGLDQQKLLQDKQIDQQNLALNRDKFGLDTQKNDQIYQTKIADMQRKAEDADAKMAFAERQLQQRAGDANAQILLHQAQIEAANAKHALDLAQKDRTIEESRRQFDARQKQIKDQLEANGMTIEELRDADGVVTGTKIVKKGAAGSQNNPSNDPGGIRPAQ